MAELEAKVPTTQPVVDPYAHWMTQGQQWQNAGMLPQALESYRQALLVNPNRHEAHWAMGVAHQMAGNLQEAETYLIRATQIYPASPDPFNSLGSIAWARKDGPKAIEWFHRGLQAEATSVRIWFNLGVVHSGLGNIEESVRCYERALALSPLYFDAVQNLIFLRDVTEDSERCWQERRNFWKAVPPVPRRPLTNPKDPDKRVRIGYLGADFWMHSACFIYGPLILSHDWDQFHITCYMNGAANDFVTDRIRDHVIWRRVAGLPDAMLGDLIQNDRIDILVDLSAFSQGTRIRLFAEKPAPVQVTAWGHALGTGLPAMDYIFMDRIAAPADRDAQFAEEVAELPSLMCWGPPGIELPVQPLPARKNGYITFGSFNRIMKLSDESWSRWAEILEKVPGSRLIVKCVQFDVPAAVENVRKMITDKFGIENHRVEIRGTEAHPKHLASYGEVDIALDPWPHGGGVTSAEAIWSGVPVVTQAGHWVGSRTGISLMTNSGHPEFVAQSRDEYVAIAVQWATNLDALEAVRMDLRDKLMTGPVGDIAGYTRAVEAQYRRMWRRYCEA